MPDTRLTNAMRRANKHDHGLTRAPLTNLQRALLAGTVGTHVKKPGAVMHIPGRSRLGRTWTVHRCRCGAPVASDMLRCSRCRQG